MKQLLKFRQWVPTELYPEGEFFYWGYGVLPDEREFVPPKDPSLPSEQYTGLTEKTGTKIYAGDILDSEWQSGQQIHCAISLVEWSPKNAHFSIRDLLTGTIRAIDSVLGGGSSSRIVGNNHENPELLADVETQAAKAKASTRVNGRNTGIRSKNKEGVVEVLTTLLAKKRVFSYKATSFGMSRIERVHAVPAEMIEQVLASLDDNVKATKAS